MSGDKASVELVNTTSAAPRRSLQEGPLALVPTTPSYRLLTAPKFITNGGQKEIYMGEPIELTTIVFTLDFSSCSKETGWFYMSPIWLERALFDNSPLPNNLENYYRTCLYGKAVLTKPNTIIVQTPINITCSGVWVRKGLQNVSWNSATACGTAEQQAWERQAEEQAIQIAETDPDLKAALQRQPRRRHIYVLPPKVPCLWAGFGDVTCTTFTCCSFVRAQLYNEMNVTDSHVIMHEAMHNFGLQHAGKGNDQYGDPTDVMGNFANRYGLLCPSAPQMYRIGVATPIKGWKDDSKGSYGNLTASNFTTTNSATLTIPAASVQDDNMLVVNLGRKDGSTPYAAENATAATYFISYRVASANASGYDSALPAAQNTTVLVHRYGGLQDEKAFTNEMPTYLASIAANGTWTSPMTRFADDMGGQLVLRVLSTNATHAVVNVCRARAVNETGYCGNGIDDDCNGFTDKCDDACPAMRRPKNCVRQW